MYNLSGLKFVARDQRTVSAVHVGRTVREIAFIRAVLQFLCAADIVLSLVAEADESTSISNPPPNSICHVPHDRTALGGNFSLLLLLLLTSSTANRPNIQLPCMHRRSQIDGHFAGRQFFRRPVFGRVGGAGLAAESIKQAEADLLVFISDHLQSRTADVAPADDGLRIIIAGSVHDRRVVFGSPVAKAVKPLF